MATAKDAHKKVSEPTDQKNFESLVQYDTAILVSTAGKRSTSTLPPIKGGPQPARAEDFLNSILPPKEY